MVGRLLIYSRFNDDLTVFFSRSDSRLVGIRGEEDSKMAGRDGEFDSMTSEDYEAFRHHFFHCGSFISCDRRGDHCDQLAVIYDLALIGSRVSKKAE